MLSTLIGIVVSLLLGALVIWVVSQLNLGLKVSSFTDAFIAAAVIAIVSWLITWLLNQLGIDLGGGILGAIVSLIVAALVLMLSDRFLSGMTVNGFGGALIAAIAIAVLAWLISYVLGIVIPTPTV